MIEILLAITGISIGVYILGYTIINLDSLNGSSVKNRHLVQKLRKDIEDSLSITKVLTEENTRLKKEIINEKKSSLAITNKFEEITNSIGKKGIDHKSTLDNLEQSQDAINIITIFSQGIANHNKDLLSKVNHVNELSRNIKNSNHHSQGEFDVLDCNQFEVIQSLNTMTDISEKINLLVLNATIAAAQVGDAGKSFADVANEIKDIAKHTSESANEIKNKIKPIMDFNNYNMSKIVNYDNYLMSILDISQELNEELENQKTQALDIRKETIELSILFRNIITDLKSPSSTFKEIFNP